MVPTRGSMRCSVANVRRSSAVDSRGEAASLSVMDVEIGGLGIAEQAGDQARLFHRADRAEDHPAQRWVEIALAMPRAAVGRNDLVLKHGTLLESSPHRAEQ